MNRSQVCAILATLGLGFILVFSTVLKDTGMSSLEQLLLRLCFSVVTLFVVLLSVSGVFLVSGLLTANVQFGLGLIFPILTGFFYAVYLWLKRHATSRMLVDYAPYQVLFNTFLFAVPSLLVVGLLLRSVSSNPLFVGLATPSLYQLDLLFVFAVVSMVLPYGLLNYIKVEEVSPTTEGLLLLGDPLLHTTWTILLFNQYVTVIQYVGGALILLSAAVNLKMSTKTG